MTLEETREYTKCAFDPVYFVETYGWALNIMKDPAEIKPLAPLFDYQKDILRKYKKNQNNIVLKSRQTGLSVITAAFVVWCLFFKKDQMIQIVANDRNGAVRFLNLVKRFIEFTPEYLRPSAEPLKDNETEIVYHTYNEKNEKMPGNRVQAVAAGPNAGRGESLSMLILDETAFIDKADRIWESAAMSLSGTKGKCIMISTPFGTGNLYHRTWTQAEKGEGSFVPSIVHWTQHPKYSVEMSLMRDENGIERPTSPWYEYQCEQLNGDPVKIAQELDLSFAGSRALVISQNIIQKYELIVQLSGTPEYFYHHSEEKSEKFSKTVRSSFWVWDLPMSGTNYIVSADVGRGDGADFSTIQVINADTVEQVAEYQGKVAPDLFAHIIYSVANTYNKAYVVAECNSFGLATTLTLKNTLKYDKSRIYHSKSIKKIANKHFGYEINENSEIPGFQTTTSTRPLVITSINEFLREGKIKLRSRRLIEEFNTFIYNNTKAEHAPGYHDDLIFALGIGLFVRSTQFEKVFLSKEFYKAMLESISVSKNDDKYTLGTNEPQKGPTQPMPGNTADEDLSWLYGPISG